ncbi:MAG: hypothetical protein Q9163_003992, partial [Psora crenata]
ATSILRDKQSMSFKLPYRSIYATAATLPAGFALYYMLSQRRPKNMLPAYEATFSVPVISEDSAKEINSALRQLPGIQETSISIPSKLVTTRGTAPPSKIISAIQSTGRSAILRGSGNANGAAVCILESPPSTEASAESQSSPVRGLARLIELGENLTMLDMTLTGLPEGRYQATVRERGDISDGPRSMGGVFKGLGGDKKGEIGELVVDQEGRGILIGEVGWRVWEMVGRGIVVERTGDVEKSMGDGGAVVVGVIARSAGAWENEKVNHIYKYGGQSSKCASSILLVLIGQDHLLYPTDALSGVTGAVGDGVSGITKTAGDTVSGLGNTAGDAAKGTTDAVGNTAKGAGNTLSDTTTGAGDSTQGGEKQTAQNPLGLSS